MKRLPIALSTLLLTLAVSCSIIIYDTRKLLNDFSTTGFLDRDHYQVIVRGKPSSNSRGLVEERKTALENASKKVNDAAIKGLSDYYITYYIAKNNLRGTQDIIEFERFREQLSAELSRYLAYGYKAYDYYESDNTAVLVYRLYKRRLLSSIESISVKPVLKQDIPSANNKK